MPPRKEPKEQFNYPPSKRKAPPFKPLRPSKIARTPTAEPASSVKAKSAAAATAEKKKSAPAKKAKTIAISDTEEDDGGFDSLTKEAAEEDEGSLDGDSDEELADNPLANNFTKRGTSRPATTTSKRSISGPSDPELSTTADLSSFLPPDPSDDGSPSIPKALLVRLMHEAWANKDTRIDSHAVKVLQRYADIFVKEALARTIQAKSERAEGNEGAIGGSIDRRWLEVEDLERVAPGMVLDF